MNWWKDKRCIFILIITTLTEMNESSVLSEEARLQQNLFNDHNPDVHPVLANKTDRAVHVMFDVQLIRILDVNERDQFIKTYVWINQYWHNPFLTWNPVEYSGISAININPKKVWVPDILLYNNVDEQDNLGGGRETYRTNVALKSDGTCTWMNPVMFKSICKIDVTYFPFDDQQCDLKFGSWSFDKSNIDMITNNQTIINKYFVANGEWNLKYIHSQRNEQYYQCCVQPFVDITVTLRVSRTSQDYLLKLVLPCSLISSMVFLVFILPPESGERIGLSITILLAMTVFQQLSSEIMPSYGFPLLGQYYFATMFELGMALLVTTVVLNIYHRRNKPMPLWFRVTVLICLKKLFIQYVLSEN